MPLPNAHSLPAIPTIGSKIVRESGPDKTAPAGIALLTSRLAAGDEEAFREFHRLYFDRLYHFLLGVTSGREHEAREALQETLLRVVRYAKPFTQEEAFWCWLKALARSAARDAWRKKESHSSLLQKFFLSRTSGPVELENSGESLTGFLKELLDELPNEDRALLEAKYFEGATVRELSLQTGLTEKAIESRLLRLRRQIREQLLKKLRIP
jgi:RNA polymerase sigma-70 factor, ECF subfamily